MSMPHPGPESMAAASREMGGGGLHPGSRAPALSHPSDQIPNAPVFTPSKMY